MDGNYLLTWLVGVSSGLSLVRTLKAHRRLTSFAALNLLALAVLGAGLAFAPDLAGYLAGAVWAVLIMLPLMTYRRVSALAGKRRYRQAVRLGRIVRWLHPAPAARRSIALFEALADDLEGRTDHAIATLGTIAQEDEAFYVQARVWQLIMGRRWPELKYWLASRAAGSGLLTHPLAAAGWVRALGETGDLAELLKFQAQVVEPLGARIGPAWLGGVRMMTLGYVGQPALVDELAASGQLSYPPPVLNFWRAIALQAAGRLDEARPLLEELVRLEPGSLGAAAGDRLQTPAQLASERVQTDAATANLAQLQRATTLSARFGTLALPPRTHVAAVTLGIVVANLVVFAFELRGGSEDGRNLYEMGALVTPLVHLEGEWWRVITAAFLHFGWLHLAMNMAALVFFGRYLEAVIGHVRYAVLYALAAPGSMALILVGRTMASAEPQLVVGASGGVMAVLGAVAAVMWSRWRHYRAPMAKRDGAVLLALVAFQAVFDMVTPEVSGLGHASGALLGFLLFWPLARKTVAPPRAVS